MERITFYSTNNKTEKANFRQAFMNGLASNYGLYMFRRDSVPKLDMDDILAMKELNYAGIAYKVLAPFLREDINPADLKKILASAYDEKIIPVEIQNVTGKTYIAWLSKGPTYSFKDFAARFLGRTLEYFLKEEGKKRIVIVATSGDTGGAVAAALHGLKQVSNIILYPRGNISAQQRRQLTTLKSNIYAFEVNGDFDVCQAIAKRLLGDRDFAKELFNDPNYLTSANSISLGRLLPQVVYPFYIYSRIAENGEPIILSIPSGNFGDMMGTVIAREMGLPVTKILCGVNENAEFPEFLKTGKFNKKPTIQSPSSAMNVSNPSNFARLVDFYGGHIYDERDKNGRVTREGVMDIVPDLESMRKDLYSISVKNADHYQAIKEVYEHYGIVIEPHGAVGWRTLDTYLQGKHNKLAAIYETAEPGKFPDDIKKAIGIIPDFPAGIKAQTRLKERIFSVTEAPDINGEGSLILADKQYEQVKQIIAEIFKENRCK
jgi:threonine synthase